MIKITVAQTAVREMKGTSKTTQRAYHMRFQNAYAHTVDQDGNAPPYPERFEVRLDDEQAPYAVGEYLLHPSSIYVRDGRAELSVRLTPVPKKPGA